MIYIHCAHATPERAPLAYGLLLAYAKSKLAEEIFDLNLRIIESPSDIERFFVSGAQNILLCSNYIWNVDVHLAISKEAKNIDKNCITIHGGPSTPWFPDVCKEFLLAHRHVDFVARGEGEELLVELLQSICDNTHTHKTIYGISKILNGEVIHYPNRAPIKDVNTIPSPYLTGVFDSLDTLRWDLTLMETNRGCMYSCSFCDWIRSKLRIFDINRVKAEMEWVGKCKHKTLFYIDANFGILKRDIEIAQSVCDTKAKYGFPQHLELCYAKNTKQQLLDIVSLVADAGLVGRGIIAVQSWDQDTLDAVQRSNIETEEIKKLANAFVQKGLPLYYNVMLGLPGATTKSFKADLRYFFDQPGTVGIHHTVMTPNAPMSNPSYIRKYGLKADKDGFVEATSTMSEQEMKEMKSLTSFYNAVHPFQFNLLQYMLLYLRYDCGYDVVEILHKLGNDLSIKNDYPLLTLIAEDNSPWRVANTVKIFVALSNGNSWDSLHREFFTWAQKNLRICDAVAFEQAMFAQAAVMPAVNRVYPYTVGLSHDVTAWHRDILNSCSKQLGYYTAAEFVVTEPRLPYPKPTRDHVEAQLCWSPIRKFKN